MDDTHHRMILARQWPARHRLTKLLRHLNELNRVFDGQAADRCGPYPGRIDRVKVTPGPQAPGRMVNRAEELAQQDW